MWRTVFLYFFLVSPQSIKSLFLLWKFSRKNTLSRQLPKVASNRNAKFHPPSPRLPLELSSIIFYLLLNFSFTLRSSPLYNPSSRVFFSIISDAFLCWLALRSSIPNFLFLNFRVRLSCNCWLVLSFGVIVKALDWNRFDFIVWWQEMLNSRPINMNFLCFNS